MFCAVSRAGGADRRRSFHLRRVVERPLQPLHAAERPADRRVHPGDAERGEQPAVDGDQIADGEEREARAHTAPRSPGRSSPARWCRGSRRAGSARRRTSDRCRPAGRDRSGCPTSRGDRGRRDDRRRGHRRSAHGRRRRRCPERATTSRRSRRRPRPAQAPRPTPGAAGRPHRKGRPAGSRRGRCRSRSCRRERAGGGEGLSRSARMSSMCSMPDRQPDRVLGDARGLELLGVQLRVRRRGGVDGQRLRVADVGEVAEQRERLDEALARRRSRP